MSTVATESTGLVILSDFFDVLYSKDEGYVSIATTRPPARRDTFKEQFFEWPGQKIQMLDYIEKVAPSFNVYFGVNLWSVPRRIKENAIPQNIVWADLDTCRPDQLEIVPQTIIESSPNHFQAVWRMDQKVDPLIAENYSKRVAYHYADLGVDRSGWDLTQLLRVPGTYNFKYQLDDIPQVVLRTLGEDLYPIDVFEALPQPTITDEDVPDVPIPQDLEALPSPEEIIYRYREHLQSTAFARYYSEEPANDWSKHLWRLINLCFEVSMSAEEVFVIAKTSKCNKYARDGRPETHLWREVLKAEVDHKNMETLLHDHRQLVMPALLTSTEEGSLQPTLVDEYMDWATQATDAVPLYHELSCCVLMSALMSTTVRLPTSHSRLVPNIWALILGDSTLTRKTTAMNMAMDFLHEIDRDLIVSSDGSPEGLLHNLSLRPKMVSIFYRDEVTGFFSTIVNQQYARAMPEIMTHMYDVPKYRPTTLRKETFVVSEPIFIFFGGGIPNRLYSLVDEEMFTSGFIPRFLVVEGSADLETKSPTGPPTGAGTDKRQALLETFQALHEMYTNQQIVIDVGGQKMQTTPEYEVSFTPEMWERAAKIEDALLRAADNSPFANMALPAFSRMYFSMLKLTCLFAAVRQEPQELKIEANMHDLLTAAHYIQRWGKYVVRFIQNAGVTGDENTLRSVYRTIERIPGIHRGQIMQRHHLNAKTMQTLEETLVQRIMIQVTPKGPRGRQYWPIGR